MNTTVGAGGSERADAPATRSLEDENRSPRDPFGAGRFRSRFTDGIWQGPTWSFAILLAILRLAQGPVGWERVLFGTGFGVVMLMTLMALLVRWDGLPRGIQVVLPLGDLVGAALMVLADPEDAAGVVLLCSLPVVWLAFEFGLRGMTAGMVVTAAVGLASLVGGPVQDQLDGSSSILLNTVFVLGLAVVARLMSGVLARVGATLQCRTDEVEAARVLAEERLTITNGVMESIDVGVIVLQDDDGPLLNEQARAMTARMGMTSTDLAQGGSSVFGDNTLTPVPPAQQVVARALDGEEFAGVMQWIGTPGDQRVIVVNARQVTRSEPDRRATVLAMWDATDLVDAIEVREEFLTTVSHELRTPLTAIIASMELLTPAGLGGGPHDDDLRLHAAITRNTALLQARIDELLTSARPGDAPLQPRRTDVTTLVQTALTKHDAHVSRSSVTLVEHVEPEVVAELDPALFEQVVDNLVSNAVKYTGAGGRVAVVLRGDHQQVVFSVVDSGAGMTFEEQRRVFDRFYRAPRARAGAIQGLGIGLSLVRSIVERHHGQIDLRSALDAGTTVTVTLPARSPR